MDITSGPRHAPTIDHKALDVDNRRCADLRAGRICMMKSNFTRLSSTLNRCRLTPLVLIAMTAAACQQPPAIARPAVAGGIADRGPALMKEYGCITCHVVPGVTGATTAVGPPLTNYGDRTFIAGRLRNEPENLVLWIQHPQRVRPGSAMPDLGVTDSAARHMAAYLYTLSSSRGARPD